MAKIVSEIMKRTVDADGTVHDDGISVAMPVCLMDVVAKGLTEGST